MPFIELGEGMDENCQTALDAAFPALWDEEIIRAVQQGVLLADDTLKSVPFLNTLVGRDLRGLMRRAAIMWRLQQSATDGRIPIQATMSKMDKGHIHHLEMCSGDFRAHVVRTQDALAFPEESETRQDERLSSQQDMFAPNIVPISAAISLIPTKYAWLTFGCDPKGKLLHCCWAMPARELDEWLARTDILKRFEATSAAHDTAKTSEVPSEKLRLKFREHIEAALRASDDDDEAAQ
jgi:hypothetical protein